MIFSSEYSPGDYTVQWNVDIDSEDSVNLDRAKELIVSRSSPATMRPEGLLVERIRHAIGPHVINGRLQFTVPPGRTLAPNMIANLVLNAVKSAGGEGVRPARHTGTLTFLSPVGSLLTSQRITRAFQNTRFQANSERAQDFLAPRTVVVSSNSGFNDSLPPASNTIGGAVASLTATRESTNPARNGMVGTTAVGDLAASARDSLLSGISVTSVVVAAALTAVTIGGLVWLARKV